MIPSSGRGEIAVFVCATLLCFCDRGQTHANSNICQLFVKLCIVFSQLVESILDRGMVDFILGIIEFCLPSRLQLLDCRESMPRYLAEPRVNHVELHHNRTAPSRGNTTKRYPVSGQVTGHDN
jgi:hypothetical protein